MLERTGEEDAACNTNGILCQQTLVYASKQIILRRRLFRSWTEPKAIEVSQSIHLTL